MCGAYVVVSECERLSQRELECHLGARGEAEPAGRDLWARAIDPHGFAYLVRRDSYIVEHGAVQALCTQQGQQHVLAPNVVVPKQARLVLGQPQNVAGRFGEALEHSGQTLATALRTQ
jgi:hypothetical protein